MSRGELFALYGISQELIPAGMDYFAVWERHCRVLAEYKEQAFDPHLRYNLVNAHWAALCDRPTIYLTLHFDTRFTDGIGEITRNLRLRGLRRPVATILGGTSKDSTYDKFAKFDDDKEVVDSYQLDAIGTDDPDFGETVLRNMYSGGSLFAAVDANQGTSEPYSAPFLYHKLNVRTGLFKLARASRANVQPFIVDSVSGQIFLGPNLNTQALGVKQTIEDCVHFLGQHVLRAPERWLHWRHLIPLTTIEQTNQHLTAEPGSAPRWVVTDEGAKTGFSLERLKLFELDDATFAGLVRSGAGE